MNHYRSKEMLTRCVKMCPSKNVTRDVMRENLAARKYLRLQYLCFTTITIYSHITENLWISYYIASKIQMTLKEQREGTKGWHPFLAFKGFPI